MGVKACLRKILRKVGAVNKESADREQPVLSELTLHDLVRRASDGDRDAAAALAAAYEKMLRRRMKGRLNQSVRRLFDSQDIFATMCRRLDRLVRGRQVRAQSVPEFMVLLHTMVTRAITDKGRAISKVKRLEGPQGQAEQCQRGLGESSDSFDLADPVEVEQLLASLESPSDQEIARQWARGVNHETTAQLLQMKPARVRKRWQLIKDRLRIELRRRES